MSGARFDPESIRALAAILTETGLTEIEIAENGSRIRVVRSPPPVLAHAVPPPAIMAPASAAAGYVAPGFAAPSTTAPPDQDALHPGAVLSPMVGIAYLSPEPGAPLFAAIGQSVTAGQTLLLIEAMKTFNQIKAPKSGTLSRVLIASGAPVEYGEVLMILEP